MPNCTYWYVYDDACEQPQLVHGFSVEGGIDTYFHMCQNAEFILRGKNKKSHAGAKSLFRIIDFDGKIHNCIIKGRGAQRYTGIPPKLSKLEQEVLLEYKYTDFLNGKRAGQ